MKPAKKLAKLQKRHNKAKNDYAQRKALARNKNIITRWGW